MKIIISLLFLFLSLQSQSLYLDAVTSLHSGHIRDGIVHNKGGAAVSQSLILDLPKLNIWSDMWTYSDISASPWQEAAWSVNTSYNRSIHSLSISAIVYSPAFDIFSPEFQLSFDSEFKLPFSVSGKLLPSEEAAYISAQIYFEMDRKIPWYFAFKNGNRVEESGSVNPDFEMALSSYFSLASFAVEPYLLLSWFPKTEEYYMALNVSFSWSLLAK